MDHLERMNGDLKNKLDELTVLYEQAQRDIRQKQADITRLSHELEKTKEHRDLLARDNKKLNGSFLHQLSQLSLLNHNSFVFI